MHFFDIYKIAEQIKPSEAANGTIQIKPVWGADMTSAEYHDWMRARVENSRRLLLPGELGCTLAHCKIYEMIVKSNKHGVIFEEDIQFEKHDLDEIGRKIQTLSFPDFIHFAEYPHRLHKTQVSENIFVADTSAGFWGTAAYLVSPKMAAELLEFHRKFIHLADEWLEVFFRSEFIPYFIPLFTHPAGASTIGSRYEASENPSIYKAISFRFFRKRIELLSQLDHFLIVRRSKKKIKK